MAVTAAATADAASTPVIHSLGFVVAGERLLAAFVFALLVVSSPTVAYAAQPNPALSPLDAELLIKVRLANLWEMPAGQMATDRSANPKVQEVGRTMMTDHAQLNIEVQRLAGLYRLQLPPEPNDMQKSWLTEMATASGSQFDSVWAMRLRAAHGLIFPVIAKSRVATTDPEIRTFATTANTIVIKHMTLLESTGVVDFAVLNDPTPLDVLGRQATSALTCLRSARTARQRLWHRGTMGSTAATKLGRRRWVVERTTSGLSPLWTWCGMRILVESVVGAGCG